MADILMIGELVVAAHLSGQRTDATVATVRDCRTAGSLWQAMATIGNAIDSRFRAAYSCRV
jgi:hypothetical protein